MEKEPKRDIFDRLGKVIDWIAVPGALILVSISVRLLYRFMVYDSFSLY